mmetsp:Transcript_21345/g.62188  ORF Transcript_21345/g.62188 Transcript_21345/m.62188 type:complete len:204 (-) Transcript_21345:3967-4578(-)
MVHLELCRRHREGVASRDFPGQRPERVRGGGGSIDLPALPKLSGGSRRQGGGEGRRRNDVPRKGEVHHLQRPRDQAGLVPRRGEVEAGLIVRPGSSHRAGQDEVCDVLDVRGAPGPAALLWLVAARLDSSDAYADGDGGWSGDGSAEIGRTPGRVDQRRQEAQEALGGGVRPVNRLDLLHLIEDAILGRRWEPCRGCRYCCQR